MRCLWLEISLMIWTSFTRAWLYLNSSLAQSFMFQAIMSCGSEAQEIQGMHIMHTLCNCLFSSISPWCHTRVSVCRVCGMHAKVHPTLLLGSALAKAMLRNAAEQGHMHVAWDLQHFSNILYMTFLQEWRSNRLDTKAAPCTTIVPGPGCPHQPCTARAVVHCAPAVMASQHCRLRCMHLASDWPRYSSQVQCHGVQHCRPCCMHVAVDQSGHDS